MVKKLFCDSKGEGILTYLVMLFIIGGVVLLSTMALKGATSQMHNNWVPSVTNITGGGF